MRILVVEDGTLLGNMLVTTLPVYRAGWRVDLAVSRVEAVLRLSRARAFDLYDAVVLDLVMADAPDPVMLCADVRRYHPAPRRLILASCSSEAPKLSVQFRAQYLAKPYEIAALVAALETP